jgi:hypothetical protein
MDSKQYVLKCDDKYIVIDPCGWPVFDDKLVGRTTRMSKEDAEKYANNLMKIGYQLIVLEEV